MRLRMIALALAAVLIPAVPAPAAALAEPAARAAVVIVLDTSGSMKGARGDAALDTARNYLGALPADVPAGLVTFTGGPTLTVAPTVDRERVSAALDTGWNATASPLYDAVALAAGTLGELPGQHRVLILSDGGDIGSTAVPADVVRVLDRYRVTADIALLDGGAADGGRAELVRATGGRVLAPGDAAARAAELASVPRSVAAAPPEWPLEVGLGCLFVALLCLGVVAFRRVRGAPRDPWHAALEPYRLTTQARLDEHAGRMSALRPLLRLGDRYLGARGRHERLAADLDLAGLALRPAEWLLIRAAAGLGLGALLALLGASWPGALAGLVLGWLASRQFLRLRISRRRGAFADQLPDTLQLVVGALQAGFSLPQALAAVVREDTQPIAGEIARALARTRLGTSVEDALDKAAERMRSTDFAWVVMAIRIQRQVGGNLSELMQTTVHTMRERSQLRRHVKALTAEGKLSAYVLTGLPILLAVWMFTSRRSYLEPLYSHAAGWVLIGLAVGCVSLGWFWMSRLIKVEV